MFTAARYIFRQSALCLNNATQPETLQSLHALRLLPASRTIHATSVSRISFMSHAHSLHDRGSSILQSLFSRVRYALPGRSRIVRPPLPASRYNQSRPPPNVGEDGPPRQAVFWGIIVLNGAVYLAWQRAYYEYVRCLLIPTIGELADQHDTPRNKAEIQVSTDGSSRISPSA